MLEIRDEHGRLLFFTLNAELDAITCPGCRVCVPQGQVCGCAMRTKGPAVENVARKTLTGELSGQREQ